MAATLRALTIASACLALQALPAQALHDSSSLIQGQVAVSRSAEEMSSMMLATGDVLPPVATADTSEYDVSKVLSVAMEVAERVGYADHLGGTFDLPGGLAIVNDSALNKTIPKGAQVDVFPNIPGKHHVKDGDNGWQFFQAAPWPDWVILAVACVVLMVFDWFVLRKIPETFKFHLLTVFIWVVAAAIFNVIVYGRMGSKSAFEWCTGYLLEWMLSMDNLFVFHLVFTAYKTPAKQIHKAVFIGIFGAVIMRMIFFMVVSTLLKLFGWFRWPFGALLIWSGIEAARGDDDDEDEDAVKDTRLIRMLKWCMGSRLMDDYDPNGESCFIVGDDGKTKATILVVVIFCLEFTDVLFALDSVSAKVAQIPDQYIAFSSSVIAMYGLRAMFFIISDLVEMFDFLKYGLCLILIFIGCELMLARWVHLSSATVCILIVGVFVVCIIASRAQQALAARKLIPSKEKDMEDDEKPGRQRADSNAEPDVEPEDEPETDSDSTPKKKTT